MINNMKYSVKQMVDGQQGMVSEIIKAKSGWGGKKKKNAYTGLPIKFFEAKSYLERVGEWFSTAPYYLNSSFLESETGKQPLERMKRVLSMVCSTLYMTVKPAKPFNPILGETFEGFMTLDFSEIHEKA